MWGRTVGRSGYQEHHHRRLTGSDKWQIYDIKDGKPRPLITMVNKDLCDLVWALLEANRQPVAEQSVTDLVWGFLETNQQPVTE